MNDPTIHTKTDEHGTLSCVHCGSTIKDGELFETWNWCEEPGHRWGCVHCEADEPDTRMQGHCGCKMIWNEISGEDFTVGNLIEDVIEYLDNEGGTVGDRINILGDLADGLSLDPQSPLASGAKFVIASVAESLFDAWREEYLR